MYGIFLMLVRQAFDPNGPSLPPPDGVEPDFDNPPNRNSMASWVTFICLALVVIFVTLRFYLHLFKERKFNDVDVLLFLAFALYIPYIYFNYRLTYSGGYFVHQWDIPRKYLSEFIYPLFVATILYLVIMPLIKIAVLREWTKIFVPKGTRNYFYWLSYIWIIFISLGGTILIVLVNTNCTPYTSNWIVFTPGAMCRFSIPGLTLASAILNVIFEVVPLILPQKIIWGLRLSTSKKLGVSLVFCVGLLACAAAVIRLYCVVQYGRSQDMTYNFSMVELASVAELACGFLVLCIPSTPKALASLPLPLLPLFSSRSGSSGKNQGSHRLSWPRPRITTRNSSRYEEVDERYLIPLTEMRHVNDEIALGNGTGITCVTQTTVTSAYSRDIGNSTYQKQHPWTRGSF